MDLWLGMEVDGWTNGCGMNYHYLFSVLVFSFFFVGYDTDLSTFQGLHTR
jgi:hypothetical protein